MGERWLFQTLFGKLHKRALLIKKQTPALKNKPANPKTHEQANPARR